MAGWLPWNKAKDADRSPTTAAAQPAVTVHLTEAAHAKLIEVLGPKVQDGTGWLRIELQGAGIGSGTGSPTFGMALEDDGPRPGDTVLDERGFKVLIDARSLSAVNGCRVDFVDDPLRPGFKIDPPAAPSHAGGHDHDHASHGNGAAAAPASRPRLDMSHPLVAAVQSVIERQINPSIASHGGRASLIDIQGDRAYVELGGGCQGCSMASVTLKQGVERIIKQTVPQIHEVIDVTDHAGGSNPFFQQSKGSASPFQTASKG